MLTETGQHSDRYNIRQVLVGCLFYVVTKGTFELDASTSLILDSPGYDKIFDMIKMIPFTLMSMLINFSLDLDIRGCRIKNKGSHKYNF